MNQVNRLAQQESLVAHWLERTWESMGSFPVGDSAAREK